MSTVDSILNLLDMWPAWKRIKATPDRVDAVEQRLAALEARLQRAPGETCPKCGEPALRMTVERPAAGPFAIMGVRERDFECENCHALITSQVRPKP